MLHLQIRTIHLAHSIGANVLENSGKWKMLHATTIVGWMDRSSDQTSRRCSMLPDSNVSIL